MTTISAKTGENSAIEIDYDIPDTLEGMVEKFGEDAVVSAANANIVVGLQAFVRRHIDKGQDEVQKLASEWLPGVRQASVKKTPLEKATQAFNAMSAEERAEILRRFQSE